MKTKAKEIRLQYNEDRQPEIVLSTLSINPAEIEEIKGIIAKGKMLDVEIKQHREKRSLDANAYAWVLITKIADVLRASKETTYIEMLKRYGQREPKLVSVIAEAVDMIYRATDNHCCEVGESELNGKVFKHLAITRLYFIWQGMKQRCFDINDSAYKWYGAKGITVCDEWLKFENFYKWAHENGYTENLTIDRKDNTRNYEPVNCKWSTVKEQNRNKTINRKIELGGIVRCVSEWSEILKMPINTIINRLNRGCSAEKALNPNYQRRTEKGKSA